MLNVSYDNTSGDHSELLNSLKALKDEVERKREEISKTASW
jgi:hypothetical protein